MPLILIGLGGFAGAIARYLVDGVVADRTGGGFPWGTLVINATGSYVAALANLGGSVVIGLVAVAAGLIIGRAI